MKSANGSIFFDRFEADELLKAFLQQRSRLILCVNEKLEVCALNEVAREFFYISPSRIPVDLTKLFLDLFSLDISVYLAEIEKTKLTKLSFNSTVSANLQSESILWEIIKSTHYPGIKYLLLSEEKSDIVNEHYLGTIIRKLPGSFYWKNLEGVYLGCSQLVADMAGVDTPAEVIGKNDYELQWKESADLVRKNDNLVVNTGRSIEVEESVKLPDGSERIFFVNKQPLRNADGEVIGVIGSSLDITEKKRLETSLYESLAREKAFKANSALGGMIAHELRTPLSSMKYAVSALANYLPVLMEGYRYWSEKEKINKIRKDHLQALEKSIGQLERSINYSSITISTILATFRPESSELSKKVFDASALVKSCIIDFMMDKPEIITYEIKDNLRSPGEPAIIEHILHNLLKNACYAVSSAGKGAIKVSLGSHNREILLEVFDTGKGISPEHIEKIFEPFFTTKESNTSIGIGLYFCKMAIEKMGGKISCCSEPGNFTKFTVYFPSC